MLRVTVEIFPGGRKLGRRTIATADIGRVKSGLLCTYAVELCDTLFKEPGVGEIKDYPRFSAPVFDLVARALCIALTGEEELPPRPAVVCVPRREADGVAYIRISDIPEPTQTFFLRNIVCSSRPAIKGERDPHGCAFARDFDDFLSGQR